MGRKGSGRSWKGQRDWNRQSKGILQIYDIDSNGCPLKVNPKYYRPTEVEELLGDASKAKVFISLYH